MDKLLAKIVAYNEMCYQLSSLAENGDVIPEHEARNEVIEIVRMIERRLGKIYEYNPSLISEYNKLIYSDRKYTSGKKKV